MGVTYTVACRDCGVCRDVDKLRPSIPENKSEANQAAEDLDRFRAALLVGFMAEHQGHNCTLFNDHADQDDSTKYRTDGKKFWTCEEPETMTQKHTPGPWEVREANGLFAIAHPDGWVLESNDEDQDRIDARLIAAAPDMLASLELLVEWSKRSSGTPKDLVDKAKAAIELASLGDG